MYLLDLVETASAVAKLVEGGFGVRYLISSDYRKRVHLRWAELRRYQIVGEIFETVIGVVVLGALIYGVYLLFTF